MLWRRLAAAFCFLFALALILNTQGAGDGTWFWYATLLHAGKKLYADLRLVQQPLFILETDLFQIVFGQGWLESKIAAVLHALAFCGGMLLVTRRGTWSDPQKALLILSGFFLVIRFEAYRFDDYHAPADCFFLYSILLLIALIREGSSLRRDLGLTALMGVFAGLTIMLRLNDGAALFGAGAFVLLATVKASRKLGALAVHSAAFALTSVSIVLLTGDSLRDYANSSIFRAAGSKGGAGSVLQYPFTLPVRTLLYLADKWPVLLVWSILVVAAASLFVPYGRKDWRWWLVKVVAVAGAFRLVRMKVATPLDELTNVPAGLWVLAAYLLGIVTVVRLLPLRERERNPLELLLLIPLAMLVSSSMSSAGTHFGLYTPVGMLVLILPIASPVAIPQGWARALILAVCGILAITCCIYRFEVPYAWHNYRVPPLFQDRQVFEHPDYGPMVIDRNLLLFINGICANLVPGSDDDLVSLPFSYANYFCAIPPWHNYVQTFFDTSDFQLIATLNHELDTAPPKWVLYQRQPIVLALHEATFNHGQRLPHRDLDDLIYGKLLKKQWHVVFRSNYRSTWLLMRTRE